MLQSYSRVVFPPAALFGFIAMNAALLLAGIGFDILWKDVQQYIEAETRRAWGRFVVLGVAASALCTLLIAAWAHELFITVQSLSSIILASLLPLTILVCTTCVLNGAVWTSALSLAIIRACSEAIVPAVSLGRLCVVVGTGFPLSTLSISVLSWPTAALIAGVLVYVITSIVGVDLLPGRSGAGWRGVIQFASLLFVHVAVGDPWLGPVDVRRLLSVCLNCILALAVSSLKDVALVAARLLTAANGNWAQLPGQVLALVRIIGRVCNHTPSYSVCVVVAGVRVASHVAVAAFVGWLSSNGSGFPVAAAGSVGIISMTLACHELAVSARVLGGDRGVPLKRLAFLTGVIAFATLSDNVTGARRSVNELFGQLGTAVMARVAAVLPPGRSPLRF